MKLRERKKQQTREHILSTAVRLFREKGFDATRVRDITEQVQISEATFFNYFPSKEALLDATSLETVELYGALLQHELAFPDRPVAERVREIIRATGQAFMNDREFMSAVVTRSHLFFGTTEEKHVRDRQNYELMAQIFREGQERGEIRTDVDPLELAEILTSTFMVLILNWLSGFWKAERELEPRLMRAVDVFLDGCTSAR